MRLSFWITYPCCSQTLFARVADSSVISGEGPQTQSTGMMRTNWVPRLIWRMAQDISSFLSFSDWAKLPAAPWPLMILALFSSLPLRSSMTTLTESKKGVLIWSASEMIPQTPPAS